MSKFPWHSVKFPDNSLTLRNFISPWHFPDGYEPCPCRFTPSTLTQPTSTITPPFHQSSFLQVLQLLALHNALHQQKPPLFSPVTLTRPSHQPLLIRDRTSPSLCLIHLDSPLPAVLPPVGPQTSRSWLSINRPQPPPHLPLSTLTHPFHKSFPL